MQMLMFQSNRISELTGEQYRFCAVVSEHGVSGTCKFGLLMEAVAELRALTCHRSPRGPN
jgi:hypothetical protein